MSSGSTTFVPDLHGPVPLQYGDPVIPENHLMYHAQQPFVYLGAQIPEAGPQDAGQEKSLPFWKTREAGLYIMFGAAMLMLVGMVTAIIVSSFQINADSIAAINKARDLIVGCEKVSSTADRSQYLDSPNMLAYINRMCKFSLDTKDIEGITFFCKDRADKFKSQTKVHATETVKSSA